MKSGITLTKETIFLFISNWRLYAAISILPAFLNYALIWLEPTDESAVINTYEWLTYIVLLTVAIVLSILMHIALICAASQRAQSWREAYELSVKKVISYVLLSIIIGALTLVGFLLLILPGVYLTIVFTFSFLFLVLADLRPLQAMKASYRAVRGRWWATFLRILTLVLFLVLLAIVLLFITFILSMAVPLYLVALVEILSNIIMPPLGVTYLYLMYCDFTKEGETSTISTPDYKPAQ
jgi:hypothetical protein